MAVKDQSQQPPKGEKPKADAQQQAPGYGDAYQQQGQASRPLGMGNVNERFRRSGSHDDSETRSAEALSGLKEAERQAVEAQRLQEGFELVRFDRNTHRVGLSSILVVKTIKRDDKYLCVVKPLLLNSESIRLRPQVEQVGMQRVEIPTRPQDVFNDVYWSRVVEFLQRRAGQDLSVYDAGPLVIPSAPDFDFKDEVATSKLLITSVNHIDDAIAALIGEQPFTITDVKAPDEMLTARVDFTGDPIHDVTGKPIRADIVISMNRQQQANQQQEQDYYERESEFNSVAGFVNLEYKEPAFQQPMMGGWGQPQQRPEPPFTPTFIITDVRQADWIEAQTLEMYLLALTNAYRVTAGTQWAKVLLPSGKKKGIDTRDIGALGYMTPQGQYIDTKSDTFQDEDLIQLLGTLVNPNPTFLLDVDPVGEHAGVESYLLDAAMPGANQPKAVDRIIQAADNLTGNEFSRFFKPAEGQKIVVPYGVDVHVGYYMDENGERRDIRDLDVLAVLNLTKGDMSDFRAWYNTYVDSSINHKLRLQQREHFERLYLAKNLVITGKAVRLVLTGHFIEALNAACEAAGLNVAMDNVTNVMGGQRFVGNQMVGQYAVSQSASMGYGASPTQPTTHAVYGGTTTRGRVY